MTASDDTATLVKVCGLTRPRDVALAVEPSAWAIGFILADSPRRVDVDAAAALVRIAHRAPRPGSQPTLAVLVFTTQPADAIARGVLVTHADAVQLSAGRKGATVGDVRDSLAAAGKTDVTIIAAATGVPLDWARLANDPGLDRDLLVLAGGLTPDNVVEAICLVRPRVVDAASGLEQRAGVKDPGLMDSGRATYVGATDDEALDAFRRLAALEGIIPALESAHAIAYVLRGGERGVGFAADDLVLVNLSGRGDKDVHIAADLLARGGQR